MAYMSQEKKKRINAQLHRHLDKAGFKWSLRVHNHSTLIMTLKKSPIDFLANYAETLEKTNYRASTNFGQTNEEIIAEIRKGGELNVNQYWYHQHFTGDAFDWLKLILNCLMEGNHDNSDAMTDYFDVGWWVDLKIVIE